MKPGWFAHWVEMERQRFFLLLPIAMGGAILVYFALPQEPPLWLGFALLAAAFLGLAVGWRHPYARFAAFFMLAAALGFARAEWRTAEMPPVMHFHSGVAGVSGFVARVEPLPGGARVLLRAPRIGYGPVLQRMVRIKLKPGDALPPPGTRVKCFAMLFPPDPPAYPGGWDQQRDYYFANIAAIGAALTPLKILRSPPPSHLANALQNLRGQISSSLLADLPLPIGSVAVTLLTGDEQIIPAQERQNFILAGLAHILAVAGLHVGIVMGLVFFTSQFLLTRSAWVALHWPCKPIAAVLALAAGGFYALLTGGHLPILRSLAMASLVTLGVLAGRKAVSMRGLGFAAMVLMLAMPEAVLSASFQMSFSAVAALIAGYAAVQSIWRRIHTGHGKIQAIGMHVAELAFTSLLAGGASMPFAAYQFQQIEPYWIPANLIAVPLTAFWIMPLGLLGILLLPLHLSALAFWPMGWGIAVIVWVTEHIATWPGALMSVPPMPDISILLIAAGLAWLCIWRTKLRLAGAGLIAAGIGAAFMARPPDALISADARLIVVKSGADLFLVEQPKASKYTLEQWQSIWGGKPSTLVQCSADICRLGQGGEILFAASPMADCLPGVRLIISPLPQQGCKGAALLDAGAAARQGAVAAWINSGTVQLRSTHQSQGRRPWATFLPQL